jgi:hypothetical protein
LHKGGTDIDYGSLTKDQVVSILKLYSKNTCISEDKLMSLYSVFGIDVFYVLILFKDSRVTFLSDKKLRDVFDRVLVLDKTKVDTLEEPEVKTEYVYCAFCHHKWEITEYILNNGLTCDSCGCFTERDIVLKRKFK